MTFRNKLSRIVLRVSIPKLEVNNYLPFQAIHTGEQGTNAQALNRLWYTPEAERIDFPSLS